MGFISCLADPDVWLRPASKTDGYQYYEYVLVYVNDVLALSHQGHMIMKGLEDFYRLKDGYHKPDLYLGAEVKEWIFLDQPTTKYWALFSSRYVKEAIKNVASKLQEQERKQRKSHQPMASNYHPELYITPYLEGDKITYYQSQISILRWMVGLGRLDIYTPVTLLSSYLTQPRQGHLEAIYIIYQYLKFHDRSTTVFDASYVQWNDNNFTSYDWRDFYQDVTEDIPSNAPEPRRKFVQINAFIDANHAGYILTRRLHTGILIYLNRAPITWYSKAKKTVESSTFGSEFILLRIATKKIKALR
jgi:hypothetical protein